MCNDTLIQRIIQATQSGLPLTPEPYQSIAEQLQISAEEVMQGLNEMQANGIIRRIAAVPNHYKLGYRYNGMTVWDVDDACIDALGAEIGSLDFVSHCYQRPRHLPEWPYNLFAMVHGRESTAIKEQIKKITEILSGHCQAADVLYSTRILKKTGLRIST